MSAVEKLNVIEADESSSVERMPALTVLSVVALAGVLIGLYMALFYAGTDSLQGHIQRIFYIHLPAFFGATLAFLITVIGGIAYLKTRKPRWDMLATAGVEVGLMLSIITLTTGSIWARPIWNTWWTWDPRLTSAAIMALTYAAYLMLRSGIESPEKRRVFASVYGILAFTTVLFTILVIRIRPDTIHPAVVGASPTNAEGGFAMTRGIGIALGVNFLVWVALVTPTLLWWRMRLERKLDNVNRLKAELFKQ